MAFSSIVRRGSASIFPLAIRSVASLRPFHGAISAVGSQEVGRRLAPFLRFTTAAASENPTATIVRLVESEIELAERRCDDVHDDIPAADGFLFRIEDVSEDDYGMGICMRGKYQDEKIDVKIYSPGRYAEIEVPASLGLFVTISKEDGQNLKFRVTTSPDEITIEQVSITTGSGRHDHFEQDFNDLDENLQKVFQKYLEIRGIKHIFLRNLFLEYRRNEEKESDLQWLKGVKGFMKSRIL